MLTIAEVTKRVGGRVLFSDVTLQVNRRDRIGLVGPNGAGKSTLFRLILGEDSPDAGEITMERGVKLGFLPQESAPVAHETVLEVATAITPEFARLRRIVLAWDADHPDLQDYHDDAHDRFNSLDGYQVEAKAKQLLSNFGFRESDFDRPARELSGGWVMRAHLARLLVAEPDLLMLDEPTNHLDLSTLLWFQSYLKGYPGAILMISHDREFLNQLVGSIVEIRRGRVFRYRGTYDEYLSQREAQEAQQLAAFKNQEREIDRLMTFVERFRAKNTKATQAQAKLKQIERMERVEAPESEEASIDFRFPQPQRSGHRVIRMQGIRHAYGAMRVYDGMDFEAERGQRIVLVGPNGAGKSTLLKLLAGVLPVQEGRRELGHNVRLGYYSQNRVEVLNPERTVLEEGLDTPQRVTEQFVRTVLGCFLFRGDDVFKKVGVLSGGEKSRLALVKLLLDPPNLLLMDEPTTHLDMASIEALIAALEQYEGTLIFISHDVYFIRSLANHVVQVTGGRLSHFPGGYGYYLDKTGAVSERAALTAGQAAESRAPREAGERSAARSKEQKRIEAEQRQARSKARREQQVVVRALEEEIATLEARQAELTGELERPETYEKPGAAVQINRDLMEIIDRLAELNPRWEAEAARLEQLQ